MSFFNVNKGLYLKLMIFCALETGYEIKTGKDAINQILRC